MKLHHVFALTIWLVLLPPVAKETVNVKAPFKQWRLTGHIFDSSTECQAWRDGQLASMRKNYGKVLTKVPNAVGQLGDLVTQYEGSVCVSTDDPRLKSK